jgi:hypothetical protein
MAKNREEWAEEYKDEQLEEQKKASDDVRSAAEDARFDEPDTVETEEQYHERLAAVRGAMIFGDTDTTAGASASGTDVPSADNEAATVAVAETVADAEEGDEDAEDASVEDARRQVDVSAGTTASAEEVDEGAEEQVEADPARAEQHDADGDESVDVPDDDVADEDLTPQQKAARTRARNKAAADNS